MAGAERLICASADLEEGGKGVRFNWAPAGGEGKGFAIRFDGEVRVYVNRCPHLGVELDWEHGQFFDEAKLYLVCSTHGAVFEPDSGMCVGGPCRGATLEPIPVTEGPDGVRITDPAPTLD